VLNDILKELRQTNYKKNNWGFNNWPAISAQSTKANQIKTDIFEKHSVFSIKAVLLNKDGESVAMRDFFLYGQLKLKPGNNIGAASTQERRMIITANSELITDDMQIRVISINGIERSGNGSTNRPCLKLRGFP
jgi:alkyl sulfatase BDS1-like metallo-beta-lactamase superfamily hydrolase